MSQSANEFDNDGSRSPRFGKWFSSLIFATITLVSAVSAANYTEERSSTSSRYQNWTVACASLSFTTTIIAVFMHISGCTSVYIVGTRLEGILSTVIVGFWAATVSISTDSKYGLAVDGTGAISNGNLYYFSWFGLITSVWVLSSYLQTAFYIDLPREMRSRGARIQSWSILLATGVVVCFSSLSIYNKSCAFNGGSDASFCRRTKFGIGLGGACGLLALYVLAIKLITRKNFLIAESFFSICLIVTNCVGVAYITGELGPGAALGNLYYFSWASFGVSLVLGASCYEDYQNFKAGLYERDDEDDVQLSAVEVVGTDVQVEDLDDI
eukprot:CAMPEP_0194353024 /NCGR_PEP_ID=MMETSP0174-20130528/1386_1 /TAXON_ID=216777 /ORGANISM="Proboscia alata, Strain PI-D3" /LENGTH=325 /DNA_ID=CAMNT_0039121379 /DNA_START=111 /DNA_END=1088 /DNA_ORIENTATION=+